MVDARLEKYFDDACLILDNLGIVYGPVRNVIVNTRAKARWGRCRYNKTRDYFDIELSSELLQDCVPYKAVMDTMLHELLHCNRNRLKHTGEWKACANIVNTAYGYNIKRATNPVEKNLPIKETQSAKYVVICKNCGNINYYKRAGKVVKLLMKNPEGSCLCNICKGTSFTVNNY